MTSRLPSSSFRGRRAGLTALLAGALVAGSAVIATTVAAPASATDYGVDLITLQTGTTNQVTLHEGTSDTPQTLSSTSCQLSPKSGVVTFDGSGKPGLRQGSIGIIDRGPGESCGQVNATKDVLTIDLGERIASQAVLDLELQQNAVVLATLERGSAITYVELQSGSSVTGGRTPEAAGGAPEGSTVTVASCQVDASSAPNSFGSDNCRWVIDDAFFTKLSLKALKGNAALEGGADGTITRLSTNTEGTTDIEPVPAASDMTYFVLASTCDPTPEPRRISLAGGGLAADSTWLRLPYNADGSECLTAGESAVRDGNEVLFRKSGGQPYAQYVFSLTWNVPAGAEEVATTVDFELGGGEVPLTWCPASLWGTVNGTPSIVGLQYASTAAFDAAVADPLNGISDYDGRPGAGGDDNGITQFGCTYGKTPAVYDPATATYTWTERVYILGDIFIRR